MTAPVVTRRNIGELGGLDTQVGEKKNVFLRLPKVVVEKQKNMPTAYLLTAHRAGSRATFVVRPRADGWDEDFVCGDEAMRAHHRYVSYEDIHQLREWWTRVFDHYTVVTHDSTNRYARA